MFTQDKSPARIRPIARCRRLAATLAAGALLLPVAARANCEISTAELPVKIVAGRAIATVGINGTSVPLMVDSGAFSSFLTEAAAAQLKVSVHPMPRNLSVNGVDGKVDANMTDVAKLDLLGASVPDVRFIVGGIEPGAGSMGIIGRDILSIADTEYDLANGVIRFVFPGDDCGDANMAYWAGKTPVSEIALVRDHDNPATVPAIRAIVKVNDKPLLALFDSGANATSISLKAARQAGIADGDMKFAGMSYGAAGKGNKSWSAPVAKIDVAGEIIRNSRLAVTDYDLHEDLLLGIDFFLSHRIYVARKRRLMFFTYNGGRVFAGNVAASAPAAASSASSAASAEDATLDADAYGRRGAASAARGDFAGALADLDRACALAPASAGLLAQRGTIQLALGRAAEARLDFDKALELDPQQVEARLQRVALRVRAKDTGGALADLAALDKTLAPESPQRVQLGGFYMSLEAPAQALAQYDLWIPHHRHEYRIEAVLYERCWARVRLDVDLDKALDDCDAAVDAQPRNASFLGARGWAWLRQGKPARAKGDFDRSLAIRPDLAFSLYGRALVEQRLGDDAASRADFAAARRASATIDAEVARRGLDTERTAPR